MDKYHSSVPEDSFTYRSQDKCGNVSQDDMEKKVRPTSQVDIIAMVRSLQRTAGMTDCFRRGNADCDRTDCDWRTYCLISPSEPEKNGAEPKKTKRVEK